MAQRQSPALPGGLPHCLKKRRLLNEKEVSREACRGLGEKFLAAGFWEDALEFFQRGGLQEGLKKLEAQALEEGDAYLLGRLGVKDREVWARLARRALELGKRHFACKAFKEAGDEARAEELARRLKEEF